MHSAVAVTLAQPAIVTIPVAIVVGVSRLRPRLPQEVGVKMLQLHVADRLGPRRGYIPD